MKVEKKAISWRRIARSLEKNDFYMRRLSFCETKGDEAKLRKFMHRYKNFVSLDSEVDNDIKRIAQEEKVL